MGAPDSAHQPETGDAVESVGALKGRALSGVTWNVGAQVAFQAISLGIAAILTRILSPRDFGLVAMTAVFTGFFNVLSKGGIATALINQRELTEAHRSTAFWLSLVNGAAIALVTVLAAPLVARFYREPQVAPIMAVIGALFILSSFLRVPEALLTRALRFRGLAISRVVATVIGGGIGIAAALTGWGVWSLLIYQAGIAVVNIAIYWWLVGWRPRWLWSRQAARELFGFAANLSGAQVFSYWTRNADNLLVGRFLGSASLGYYSRGYNLMLVPLMQINEVIGAVMWPSLSRIQDDRARVRSIMRRAIGVITLVMAPLTLGAFVLAQPLLVVILGPKWMPAVPVFRILALAGLFQSISSAGAWLFQSQGRTDLMLRWQGARGVLVILGFVAGIWIGTIEAVAAAFLLVSALAFPFDLAIPGRLVQLSLRDALAAALPSLACALTMTLAVAGLGLAAPPAWPTWLLLAVQIAAGAGVYLLLVHLLHVPAYREARQLLVSYARRPASDRQAPS